MKPALRSLTLASVTLALAAAGGCSSASAPSQPSACAPGRVIACACGGGSGAGTQTCNAAGSGYGACACAGNDAGRDAAREGGKDASPDGGTPPGGPVTVTLKGALAKGPFIWGSPVVVNTVDGLGHPTGLAFLTETNDTLGDFTVTFAYQGPVLLQGSGYYYNEITGALSGSSLTLDAYATISAKGSQSAYVNLVTHLTHDRIQALLGGGGDASAVTLAAATSQAESELFTALQIGGAGFDPGAPGTQMNLLTGDTDANGYLFAVSALFAQYAVDTAGSGSIDAALQNLVNTTAASFGTSGTLDATWVAALLAEQTKIEPYAVTTGLASYFAAEGTPITPPDIDRALDSDLDGVRNDADTCPLIANPTQLPMTDRVCDYQRSFNATPATATVLAMGDVDGDMVGDVIAGVPPTLQLFLGQANGTLAAPTSLDVTSVATVTGFSALDARTQLVDIDGDGLLDLFTPNQALAWMKGNGDGTFQAAALIASASAVRAVCGKLPVDALAIGDVDGDTVADVIGSCGVVFGALSTSASSWAAPSAYSSPAPKGSNLVLADFNGDLLLDVAYVYNAGDVAIGLADGSGGFAFGGFSAGAAPAGPIAAGDFDGDGALDVVVAVAGAPPNIVYGDGTGAFTASPLAIPGGPSWFLAGDVTGDGVADLVSGTNVLSGETDRTFTANAPLVGGTGPWTDNLSGVVDMNHDGVADIVFTLPGAGGVAVYRMNVAGYGGF